MAEPATVTTTDNRRSVIYFIENKPFLVLTVIGLGFLAVFAYNQLYPRPNRLITTVGLGTKTTQAQKATITFVLTVDATDRASVLTNGEIRFNDILAGIQKFSPEKVNKTAYQIAPLLNNLTGETRAYRYANGAQITMNGTQNIDNLIRMLSEKEAAIAQVRYLPADEKASNAEVRQLAITDAHDKAVQMARSAGANLGKVINVVEQPTNGGATTTSQSNTGGSFVANAGVANSTSDIQLQSVIQVTYELK